MNQTQFKIFDRPVTLDDSGYFHVTLDTGERLKSISILGLNSKAKKAKGFESFPVLRYDRYGDESKPAFVEAQVVGVVRDRHHCVSYRLSDNRFAESVILDTDENRLVLRKIKKLRLRERDVEQQMKGLENSLERRNPRHAIRTAK